MVFSSLIFLFIFLPAVLLVYYLPFGRAYKNSCLFALSLVFYAWGEPIYVLLMLFSISVNFIAGLLLERYAKVSRAKKAVLVSSIILNLSLIGVFKYAGFAVSVINGVSGLSIPIPQIALPIGISFYTFQIMTYVIDVYRGDQPTQKNYLNLGTYITMFPQLIAGPIVRYGDIADQLSKRSENVSDFAKGIRIFISGLGKKVLLANSCGFIADSVIDSFGNASSAAAWVAILAYAFQIFFDFSGYSTMAIGLGYMFGFKMPENFNYPYTAVSVTDFWRRWHMTLSEFFRDYLYIPLGGNRVKLPRWLLNIMVVWFATGLWHGASFNFILWGLYYGALLVLEKLFLLKFFARIPKFFGWLFTAVVTIFGWVLFRLPSLPETGEYFKILFGAGGEGSLFSYGVISYLPWLFAAALFSTTLPKRLFQKLRESAVGGCACDLLTCGLFLFCVAALTTETFNPFIYFRF